MGQSRNLPLAIAAVLSVSVVSGCTSISNSQAKIIPTKTASSSPYIVKEEVAFLSATRSRASTGYNSSRSQQQGLPREFKSNDLYQAAQALLGESTASASRHKPVKVHSDSVIRPRAKPSSTRVAQKVFKPSVKTKPQIYRLSNQDSMLDNPLYEKVLLELAGLIPKTSNNQPQQATPLVRPAPVTKRPVVIPARAATPDNFRQALTHAPHEDMWNHVKAGYQMGNHGHKRSVQRFVRSYGRKPQRLQRIADRATNYLHIIVNELKRRRMPTELALLPFVESAYVNTAYSHAGAAGMWQFIPSTGLLYGLKQNRGFDGRMDALESTRAALDYLQKLHHEFHSECTQAC